MSYRPGGPIEGLDEEIQNCLPTQGPLHRYLAWAIKTTDAEAIYHLGSILPAWSHEVAMRGFTIDEGQRLIPRVWSFLVGVPASSKSTAMKRSMQVYRAHLAATAFPGDPYIIAEGSVPGIFEALCDHFDPDLNMSRGIIYRDEAARLLDTTDSVADMFCNIIDGEEVKRHLRGLRKENRDKADSVKDTLRRPAFSGLLTTTFSRLREVTKSSYLEGGLYSRFFWFVGQPSLSSQSLTIDLHRDEEPQVVNAWEDWAQWANGQAALGVPLVARVPRDVIELLRATLFADLQRHSKRDDRLNAARKRAITQAIVIAGLYAISQCRLVVEADDMDRAINLVELCMRGLERLDPTLVAEPVMVHADQAFHAIAAAGDIGLSRPDLYKVLKKSQWVVEQVVETLTAEGSITIRPVVTHKRGRPPHRYVANGPSRYAGAPPDPEDDGPATSPTSDDDKPAQEPPARSNVIRMPKRG